jgi:hypothetical protein
LLLESLEDFTLNYADGTTEEISLRVPIESFEPICKKLLARLNDKGKITLSQLSEYGHCAKTLIRDEMKKEAEEWAETEYKNKVKEEVEERDVLPSFDITLPFCCYWRFHGKCYRENMTK